MAFEREIRDAEIIERWGVVRMHRRGSMGAHAHRVAIYADQIADILNWQGDRAALLRWALWHDMPEVFTGDLPGPMKRALGDPVTVREYELDEMRKRFMDDGFPRMADAVTITQIMAIVKLADLLDEMLSLVDDRCMGNTMLDCIIEKVEARLHAQIASVKTMPHPGQWDSIRFARLDREIRRAVEMHQVTVSRTLE